jgi:hypothetical protein
MTDERAREQVSVAVGISAVCFAALGVLLLFAPRELAGALLASADGDPLVQLLGAALLGSAAMNWTARGSVLGGIYGRAVVVGNQTHLTIGALLLVKHGLATGGSAAYWVLAGVYLLGAALFLYLAFGSGIRVDPSIPREP